MKMTRIYIVLGFLLLAGCQGEYKGSSLTPSKSGKGLQGDTVTKHPPIPYKSINTAADSLNDDTMSAYIQRIKKEWWQELHGESGVELNK